MDIPYGIIEFWDNVDLEREITHHLASYYLQMDPELHDYLISLRQKCDQLHDVQRRIKFSDQKKLVDVYVELLVIEVPRGHKLPIKGKKLKKKDHSHIFQDIEDLIYIPDEELQNPKDNIFIVGGPGSGKSCLLRKSCIRLIELMLSGKSSLPIPIFLNAEYLIDAYDELDTEKLCNIMYCSDVANKPYLARKIKELDTLLYIDGFDELASNSMRSKVLDSLVSLTEKYPKIKVLAASRPIRMWRDGLPAKFKEGRILPIRRRAMASLLERLITKPKLSALILKELTESEVFQRLPRTPLVVTLIALLHETEDMPELPANLAELYDLFCLVYLERWSKEGRRTFDSRIAVLERFSMKLHESYRTRMKVEELLKISEEHLEKIGDTTPPLSFVTKLISENLLLECQKHINGEEKISKCNIDLGGEYCDPHCDVGFIHQSFQEFFVARLLRRRPEEGIKILSKFFDEPWWGAIGIFFSGFVKDIPNLIDAIIEKPIPEGPYAMARMVNLGHLTQAATLTSIIARQSACEHGSNLLHYGYEYSARINQQIGSRITKFYLLAALCFFFEQSFSSAYLHRALKLCFVKILHEFKKAEKKSGHRGELGIKTIALSWALANSGDPQPLLDFAQATDLSDGVLVGIATVLLEDFQQYIKKNPNGMSMLETREAWMESVSKLKKKVMKYKDMLQRDMEKIAIPDKRD